MTRVDNYINMMKEFCYNKCGKEMTIEFLKYMIKLFEETYDYEWEDSYVQSKNKNNLQHNRTNSR